MIILESIRLRNFGPIKEATFKPETEGITGIFGMVGAGKTTFLSATMFALFGVRPQGFVVGALRRTGSGSEECSVSVVFTHLGQTVEIIREIKGSTNKVIVDLFVDGVPQTVTSGGAADTWIGERLGVDAQGFLTAFIVRQKELDDLVKVIPSKRKAAIEKLAGIDTINEALKKARKDESTAKEVLGSLPGSEKNIEEAEAQVQLLATKTDELRNVKEDKQETLNSLQNTLTEVVCKIEKMRAAQQQIFGFKTRIGSLNTNIEMNNKTINKLQYVADVDTQKYDIENLREQHKEVSALLEQKTVQLNALRVQKQQTEHNIAGLQTTIEEREAFCSTVTFSVEDETGLVEKSGQLENQILELKNRNAILGNKIEDYKEKVAALTSSNHNKNCPTCDTILTDPEKLVEEFEQFIVSFEDEQLINLKTINSTGEQLKETTELLKQVRELKTMLTQISEDKKLLIQNKETLTTLPDPNIIEQKIIALSTQKDEVTELGLTAKRVIGDKAEYEKATTEVVAQMNELNELQPQLTSLETQFSDTKYQTLRQTQEKHQKEVNYLSKELNETFSELSTMEARFAVASNNLRSAVEQWKRKKELLKAQEQKALTTEVIDKFRRDSVASLAPELSENATALISNITNGTYTEIKLDDDFNVTVVNSIGEEYPVGVLSGGEESAVAFALRLAIAFLITGGNPSLLWLDEILVSQDEDRRESMLSTIRNLPIDQIIMINHAQGAADIVDKAVTVVRDLSTGSVLYEAGDEMIGEQNLTDDEMNPFSASSLDDIEDD